MLAPILIALTPVSPAALPAGACAGPAPRMCAGPVKMRVRPLAAADHADAAIHDESRSEDTPRAMVASYPLD